MKKITNEGVKGFELYLYEEEKSDNTIEKYMRDIRFFREWLGGKGVDKSVVLPKPSSGSRCESSSTAGRRMWRTMKNN